MRLNEVLNQKGIEVDQVLVRYFKYSQEIQKNLEEYKRKLEEARGEVNKMVADADGQYLEDKIEADVTRNSNSSWPRPSRPKV